MRNQTWLGRTSLSVLLGISLVLPVQTGFAAERRVQVTLPSFAVTLNGHTVDQTHRTYPLLVYRDVTYVPMTWDDARLLGLETTWSEKDGLRITKQPVTSSYQESIAEQRHTGRMEATIPSMTVSVNGVQMSNEDQPYPFLLYRDVTYFPLTWAFAHDAFGWAYSWSETEGLTIASSNPQLQSIPVTEDSTKNGVGVYNGYIYFTEADETTNTIYRFPIDRQGEKEAVYTYTLDMTYGRNTRVSFERQDDGLSFSYHRGGATMGSDVYGLIDADGAASILYEGYLQAQRSPLGTLKVNQSIPPSGGNVYWLPADRNENDGWQPIGETDMIYGWHIRDKSALASDRSSAIVGDEVTYWHPGTRMQTRNQTVYTGSTSRRRRRLL